jgi:hypothetical protein
MGSTSACEAETALFASSRIRSSRRRFTRCTSGVEKDCFWSTPQLREFVRYPTPCKT